MLLVNTSVNASYFKWEFSDGVVSYEVSPSRLINQKGSYSVKLTATNNKSEDDSDFIIINVNMK